MKIVVTQNQRLASTLNGLLFGKSMMASFIIASLLFISLSIRAQNNIRVKGQITAEKGQPVDKASILVKGTTAGTSSDPNGNFEITAPSNATLVISGVGYGTKEARINGKSEVNVQLTSSGQSLDHVIVVGYGTQKKRDVTGSVVSVSGDALREVPSANVISQLQGR